MNPTVAIINATPASMAPAARGLLHGFPEAGIWHLMDDRLVGEADAAGGMTGPLRRRMLALIDYAVRGGADGVLLSCSMYGPVAGIARQLHDVPVLGSDETMFAQVAAERPGRVLLLGSLESAVADSVQRLNVSLEGADSVQRLAVSLEGGDSARRPNASLEGAEVEVVGVTARGAAAAAATSDEDGLLDALVSAALPHVRDVWLVLLAQYSLTTVDDRLRKVIGVPVLSPPEAAARHLRSRLLGGRP